MRFNVPPWLAHVFKHTLPLITFTNSFAQSLSNETQAASVFVRVKQFALIFCFSGSTTCHDAIIYPYFERFMYVNNNTHV